VFTPLQSIPDPVGVLSEDCDGEDLRNQSCQARGFASGSVACTDGCFLNTNGCDVCAEFGALGVTCAVFGEITPASVLSAAVDDESLVVVYTSDALELRVARFDLDLVLSWDRGIPDLGYGEPRIARGVGEWAVLGTGSDGHELFAVSDDGDFSFRYARPPSLSMAPLLLSRPSAGPLLLDVELGRAELLADELRAVEQGLSLETPGIVSGAWVEDGFLLAGTRDFQPVVLRLELDPLAVTETAFAAQSLNGSERVTLAPVPGGAVLLHDVWSEPALYHRLLDPTGAQVGPVTDILPPLGVLFPGPFVATSGENLIVPFSGDAQEGPYGFRLLHSRPFSDPPTVTLVAAPAWSGTLLILGGRVVAVFQTAEGLGLASFPMTP
jgi:hypothetical protein